MAFTAECLVESIEHVREEGKMTEEFFGLVILPIVSFAADGAVATIYFMRYMFALFLGRPQPPAQLAKGRAIDMSVQFTLFWLPFLVLLGWWTEKPLHLMFDLYEVTLLVGACFLVNTVTADAKTNWVEGFILVGLYGIIACVSWFYTGQESSVWMLRCASVLIAGEHEELAHEQKGDHVGGGAGSEGGHGNATEVAELAARMAVKMVRRMMEERANR
jgi:Ca2+:H+ antiporter